MLNLITIISYDIASVIYCHDENYSYILAAKHSYEDLEKSEISAFQKAWLSQIPPHKTLHLNTSYCLFSKNIQLSSDAKILGFLRT